ARLHRDAVDETAHDARPLEQVVAEDPSLPAVRQQEGREQPNEGRLARAVLAQNGDALAPAHRERHALQRHPPPAGDHLLATREDLGQITNCNCLNHRTMLLGIEEKETERRRTSTAASGGEASRLCSRSRSWIVRGYNISPTPTSSRWCPDSRSSHGSRAPSRRRRSPIRSR